MFTAQIVLLAATAVAPLASNAAPILSGIFFNSKRADSNVQTVQGTNFFFSNLRLEDSCQPGQVACVNSNLATCSPEANWEITPCGANTSCFAVPNAANTAVDVKCTSESDANAAITQAGGQGGVSVDFQVNAAPFPDPNAAATPTGTDATPTESGDNSTPSGTDGAAEPTESCTPDDGSNDGSGNSDPFPTGTVVDEPTITDAPAEPTDSCTADEPEQTETITLILVPNPTAPGGYETSTFTGNLPEATASQTASFGVGLGPGVDVTDVPTGTDAAPSDATPTESCTDTEGGDAGYTDAPSDAAPTDGAEPTSSPITLTFGTPSPAAATPTSSTPIVVVGTHNIPANPTKRAINPFRFVKVRRS